MARLLTDADVSRLLSPEVAVAAARRALVDAYRGALAAPPRLSVDAGEHTLVMTAGGYADGPVGFRAYGLWPGASDQAVLVWDGAGALQGIVVGSELGARRTGALGGVAVDVLARRDASRVAVIGSGVQAWTQLWAITAVRALERVDVWSPSVDHRTRFAGRARTELGLEAHAAESARAAVAGADIVVLATRSTVPVIQPEWLAPGVHVSTVGPKSRSAHETPAELADAAALVASDAPAQAAAYAEPFFTSRPLTHLGRLAAEPAEAARGDDDVTLYCSTGLAGSEVVLAAALLERG
jgi:ornithine cyclodeaminase